MRRHRQDGSPLHLRPSAVFAVAVGALIGTPVRYELGLAWPSHGGLPRATLAVNLVGAFILGALLEVLGRAGADTDWRQRARLLAGTGFCGSLTTYSTLAVESDLLIHSRNAGLAATYAMGTVIAGLIAAAAGIGCASIGASRWVRMPDDPDAPAPRETLTRRPS